VVAVRSDSVRLAEAVAVTVADERHTRVTSSSRGLARINTTAARKVTPVCLKSCGLNGTSSARSVFPLSRTAKNDRRRSMSRRHGQIMRANRRG
jgi:hypothetical protein